MLSPTLSISAYQRELAETSRVRIPNVLTEEIAERLHHCLERETPWGLARRSRQNSGLVEAIDYQGFSPEQRSDAYRQAMADSGDRFAFAYDSYQMIPNYLAKRDPGHFLHRITEALNSAQWLAFARELTGDPRITKTDCQATCYRPGQFLSAHDDRFEDEGRLYAFVLGMTRSWHADWGGLLHFLDSQGDVIQTYRPAFNTLVVFRVPQYHLVSMVTELATEGRYSITGWFRE